MGWRLSARLTEAPRSRLKPRSRSSSDWALLNGLTTGHEQENREPSAVMTVESFALKLVFL